MLDMGCRTLGIGCWMQGAGHGVWDMDCRTWDAEYRIPDVGCRTQDAGHNIWDLGCRM